MRILMLGDIRPPHLKRWRDYFKSRGHEVMTMSLESDPVDTDYTEMRSLVPVRALKYILARRQALNAIAAFKPDVINAHYLPNYGLLAAVTRFHPVAVSLWGSDILISAQKSFLHHARAMWILRRCDLITSDCKYMTGVTKSLGSFNAPILTEPMGVPRAVFDSLRPPKPRSADGSLTIVSTRVFEPRYQVGLLIEAMRTVVKHAPHVKCIIAGRGSLHGKLEEMAKANCPDSISLVGWKTGKEYFDLLKNADIYVSCSAWDSTSVSLVEAMAAGAFPVVSRIPGNDAWVDDGISGLYFPVGDGEALVARLLEAVSGSDLRESAAVVNRQKVESAAIWEDSMDRIEREFEKLVCSK